MLNILQLGEGVIGHQLHCCTVGILRDPDCDETEGNYDMV